MQLMSMFSNLVCYSDRFFADHPLGHLRFPVSRQNPVWSLRGPLWCKSGSARSRSQEEGPRGSGVVRGIVLLCVIAIPTVSALFQPYLIPPGPIHAIGADDHRFVPTVDSWALMVIPSLRGGWGRGGPDAWKCLGAYYYYLRSTLEVCKKIYLRMSLILQ